MTPNTETPTPQTPAPEPAAPFAHRGNGKVARLPKPIRDQVNQWLLDGLSYPDIIQRLGDHGRDLTPNCLSQWKKRGHQDWLLEQSWLAQTRARQEAASELSAGFDATQVNHAALQLATLHILDTLRDLGPGSLDQKLGGDCAAFTRLIHALARASRETVQLQKYRDACARARAALLELKDPSRKLTESETRAIVLQVDDILGLRSQPPA